jgi:hypothetical protein
MRYYKRECILSTMRAAIRKGFDPYNSFDAYGLMYSNLWRLNRYA